MVQLTTQEIGEVWAAKPMYIRAMDENTCCLVYFNFMLTVDQPAATVAALFT